MAPMAVKNSIAGNFHGQNGFCENKKREKTEVETNDIITLAVDVVCVYIDSNNFPPPVVTNQFAKRPVSIYRNTSLPSYCNCSVLNTVNLYN